MKGALSTVAAAALALGCGAINTVRTKAPDPAVNEGEWAALRNLSTRRAVLYDEFQYRATVTATYLSPQLREARAQRLAKWLGLTDKELADRLAQEVAEAAKFEDFTVSLFTADRSANDLDAKKSVWRLALRLEDGSEILTHDAEVLEPDATVRNLYPYVSPFDVVYRVRFNRAPGASLGGRLFTFELASALGKAELHYGDGAVGPDLPFGERLP
ncbi:MAG TPA: hypothetical protein VFG53_21205 [Anaeromyxobacter sp.]|nr:hypothetical protein [Anaeromyxobacter sp.]